MLTPAEQLGLAGAALDARVRQAVNFIPDSTLVHVARRLAEDARASDVVYDARRRGRDRARHAAAAARDARAARLSASRLHADHERARALPRALRARRRRARRLAAGRRRARLVRRGVAAVAHAETPLYGRLDAVCDFTSARWQDSLKFMEPNLSGVGGIHLGPLAETLVMRDVVPTLQGYDPLLAIDAPRDQRDLFLQVLLDHARTIGSAAGTWRSSSRSTSPKGPTSNRTSSSTIRAQRGIELVHADPRELRLIDGDVFLRRRAHRRRLSRLRDPRSAWRSSTRTASGSTPSARCSCRTAWCRPSAATSTTRAAGKC